MNDILETKQKSETIRKQEIGESLLSSEKSNYNKDKKLKKKNYIITGLSIATALLAISTVGFGIGFAVTDSQKMQYKSELENSYQSNFYSLVDSVNNLETKISKTINSSTSNYQRKILLEASKNASEAEIAVASLPFSQNDIQETVKMVNQISGYTSTLADKLADGGSLTDEDKNTLDEIEQSILSLKTQLNEFAERINRGYSIVDASMNIDTDSNDFSRSLSSLKDNDVEYPTMIYDGPFSDSVTNSTVKGLSGDNITKAEAKANIEKYFKSGASAKFVSETNGKFKTYNFNVTNSSDNMLFVQVTKVGGHVLTISGAGDDGKATIDMEKAKNIAVDFAKQNGIENATVVWSDSVDNDVYLNIAPVIDDIVLYPDLVKVKVNLVTGNIVGYDATSYFTNHVDRSLSKGSLTFDVAKAKVPSKFTITSTRYVLSPLDYNREVVCIEVEGHEQNSTYYFYYNVTSGKLENVLKVIETDNGNLLM